MMMQIYLINREGINFQASKGSSTIIGWGGGGEESGLQSYREASYAPNFAKIRFCQSWKGKFAKRLNEKLVQCIGGLPVGWEIVSQNDSSCFQLTPGGISELYYENVGAQK